jgi:hypothetical protein
VPGTADVRVTVADGPAGDVLIHVLSQVHARVESLELDGTRGELDDWGYAARPIRGGTTTSNHASATAVDGNATRHPLGVRGTFTARQAAEIRQILAEVEHVVRWGGDYQGRPDEMHFEINAGHAAVARVAARLSQEDDMPTAADILYAKVARQGSVLGGQTSLAAVVANFDSAVEKAAARDAAILAAISADKDITPAQLAELIDRAVAEHTPSAEEIATAIDVVQRPLIMAAVLAALGEDNTDQAEAIVDAIVDRLANPTTEGTDG